jgi:uncharacterized protein YkvS
MSYIDLYVCAEYITRIQDGENYVVISNVEYYQNRNSIDVETTIYENSRDIYFDELTINSTLTLNI